MSFLLIFFRGSSVFRYIPLLLLKALYYLISTIVLYFRRLGLIFFLKVPRPSGPGQLLSGVLVSRIGTRGLYDRFFFRVVFLLSPLKLLQEEIICFPLKSSPSSSHLPTIAISVFKDFDIFPRAF